MKRESKELLEALEELKRLEKRTNPSFKASEMFEPTIDKLIEAIEDGRFHIGSELNEMHNKQSLLTSEIEDLQKISYANSHLNQAIALLEEVDMNGNYATSGVYNLLEEARIELSEVVDEDDFDEE